MHSVSLISQQKEVQRKLGRNMLLLQHYEQLLKDLLSKIDLVTPTLDSNHNSKIANTQKKMMGQLVGEFFAKGVTTEKDGLESADDCEESCNREVSKPHIRTRVQFIFPEEELQNLEDAMANLIARRNELVHHFLAKFNLQTIDSCSAAESYLDEACAVFKNHLDQLKSWHETTRQLFDEQRKAIASPEFERWLVHGIHPDGSVDWERSSIVRSLIKAWADPNQDGWIKLDDAIAAIKSREPDLSPSLFGCKSWRQLLKRSQQFEIRLDNNSNTGRGQCWFRPKKEEQHGETVKN